MWIKAGPEHNHDGSYQKCDICQAIVGCRDNARLVESVEAFNNLILGGAKSGRSKKSDEQCSIDAISTISQEANKVLNYIYSHYKDTEGSHPITEGMISHLCKISSLTFFTLIYQDCSS
jgi:hypothetical protein